MPYPAQTFNSLAEVLAYINNNVVTNGDGEIDAVIANNALNGLGKFIYDGVLNRELASVQAGGGAVILSVPITIFTAIPTSIQWPGNICNEYYIGNATNSEITIADGYFYRDINLVAQHGIPSRTVVHIVKTSTGQWMQINNASGGSSLPSQSGHVGEALFTNGSLAAWMSPQQFLDSSNFESNGKTAILPDLDGYGFSLFWNQVSQYLIENTDWAYINGGGFIITRSDFDANASPVDVILTLKKLT